MAAAYECTEAGDFGSPGDNETRCTGAGCTLAGLYAKDIATATTLMAATAVKDNEPFTSAGNDFYPVRPTDALALQITFTIASKTAETDYIWITGTDAWGNDLYECIDVSAGNGSYTTTEYFATITQIDCEDVGDGSGTSWADGTLAITQPRWGFVWNPDSESSYQIDCFFRIGDGTTTTALTSVDEYVFFKDTYFTAFNNATLTIGYKDGSNESLRSTRWHVRYNNNFFANDRGNIEIYGSTIKWEPTVTLKQMRFYRNGLTINDSLIDGCNSKTGLVSGIQFYSTLTSLNLSRNTFVDYGVLIINKAPDTYVNNRTYETSIYAAIQIGLEGGGTLTLENVNVASSDLDVLIINDYTLNLLNPTQSVSAVTHNDVDAVTNEQYSTDFYVVDSGDTALSGVTVTWTDSDSNTGNDTTGVGGTVSFDLTIKQWTGSPSSLTGDYNDFTFTFVKSGYETITISGITISEAIDWTIQMKPAYGPWQKGWR